MIYGVIKSDDMPHPACLVEYGNGEGGIMAAMFHYASENCDITEIAAENGYDVMFAEMPGDDPLFRGYAEDGDSVVGKWRPAPPEGWVLGGVTDSEDGPVAIFLKAFADVQDEQQENVA